jgi:hypothetical protein
MKENGGHWKLFRRFLCSHLSREPKTCAALQRHPLSLPQLAEINIPQQMDAMGEYWLYDGCMAELRLLIKDGSSGRAKS